MTEFTQEYERLAHAIQTGVSYDQAHGSNDGSAKHLRVGINCRACDHAALVRVLIAKGIVTEEEYEMALLDEMRTEVKRYEDRLTQSYGAQIKLL